MRYEELQAAIEGLRDRLNKVDSAIGALEGLLGKRPQTSADDGLLNFFIGVTSPVSRPPRSRPSMSLEARKNHSKLMKEFWEKKKDQPR